MDREEIDRLLARLRDWPAGEFHFPDLYGRGWDGLYIGDKVKTGRAFMNAVRAGKLPGGKSTGRKQRRGRVYVWSGA